MNHDITHCKGGECPLKEHCYRYKAYLEPYDYPKSVFNDPPYNETQCNYYEE